MNMPYQQYDDQDADYQNEPSFRTEGREKFNQRRKRATAQRRKTPQAFNGIHRRRNKRFTW
jgi:hypothetical protein